MTNDPRGVKGPAEPAPVPDDLTADRSDEAAAAAPAETAHTEPVSDEFEIEVSNGSGQLRVGYFASDLERLAVIEGPSGAAVATEEIAKGITRITVTAPGGFSGVVRVGLRT